jgi:hypothetical protein
MFCVMWASSRIDLKLRRESAACQGHPFREWRIAGRWQTRGIIKSRSGRLPSVVKCGNKISNQMNDPAPESLVQFQSLTKYIDDVHLLRSLSVSVALQDPPEQTGPTADG